MVHLIDYMMADLIEKVRGNVERTVPPIDGAGCATWGIRDTLQEEQDASSSLGISPWPYR
jgi:hypothetical protein